MSQRLSSGRSPARRRRRGATMLEMTLVGIPTIFILISIFEISRGIWMYETLAYAAKAGVRFASVHGADCVQNQPSIYNSCAQTAAQIAGVVKNAGIGLDTTATNVKFTSHAGSFTESLSGTCVSGAGTCPSAGVSWPPNDGVSNTVGQTISIEVVTPFRSALAMFWPGARAVSFALSNLAGSSQDTMRY